MKSIEEENHYDSFAGFYDDIMLAGYYDYDEQIQQLCRLIPRGSRVLELGVGTGLLAEKLVDFGYEVAGVDHTAEMIELARERLGPSADLFRADVRKMNLPRKYECAISNGGVWYGVSDKDTGTYKYCGHLNQIEDIRTSIQQVCDALTPNARVILSIQDFHKNLSLNLPDGGKYTQEIERLCGDTIRKKYVKTTDLGQQTETLNLTYIDKDVFEQEFQKYGFSVQKFETESKYITFKRNS